jgi:hypothetical protein
VEASYDPVNVEVQYDPLIPLINKYPKELRTNTSSSKYFYTYVHSTTVHSSEKVETTQMSVVREWNNKSSSGAVSTHYLYENG